MIRSRPMKLVAIMLIAAFALTACAGLTQTQQRVITGGLIGTGVGVGVAAVTGGSVWTGAAIGAAGGVITGFILGETIK